MGKHGKKKIHRRGERTPHAFEDDEGERINEYSQNYLAQGVDSGQEFQEEAEDEEIEEGFDRNTAGDVEVPSKFWLYQQSVQSPKGDISYLQKFFLMYVGGRAPLHLQEDFCGTALLSVEWLRSDARRTAVSLDLDAESLHWCIENNLNSIGTDIRSQIYLFHGNVLQPLESELVNFDKSESMQNMTLEDSEESPEDIRSRYLKDIRLPSRDIVCAFNYSCCCLHSRQELVLYFRHALGSLSRKGGIFVMDLYGGTSSEGAHTLKRSFPSFTYIWEQDEFDVVQRQTRISLHFNLRKPRRKLRHAFSYSWRLWTLPEIKDCLEEAGFCRVHFWIKSMPNIDQISCVDGNSTGRDNKYEEVTSFQQQDSWNAYVVGVA